MLFRSNEGKEGNLDVGLAKNTNPNAPLPSNGPLSHNLASTTPPRTNRRSAKRKGKKKKKEEEGQLWNVLEFGGMAGKKRRKEG